ncbi:ADP-ribosyltransferase, partial [Elusimicrobiota bacterium]
MLTGARQRIISFIGFKGKQEDDSSVIARNRVTKSGITSTSFRTTGIPGNDTKQSMITAGKKRKTRDQRYRPNKTIYEKAVSKSNILMSLLRKTGSRLISAIGILESGETRIQQGPECAFQALYHHPKLAHLRNVMDYELFKARAIELLKSRYARKNYDIAGLTFTEIKTVMDALGLGTIHEMKPLSQAQLLRVIRREEHVAFARMAIDDTAGRHLVIPTAAYYDADAGWMFTMRDSINKYPSTYTFDELTDLDLELNIGVLPSLDPSYLYEKAIIFKGESAQIKVYGKDGLTSKTINVPKAPKLKAKADGSTRVSPEPYVSGPGNHSGGDRISYDRNGNRFSLGPRFVDPRTREKGTGARVAYGRNGRPHAIREGFVDPRDSFSSSKTRKAMIFALVPVAGLLAFFGFPSISAAADATSFFYYSGPAAAISVAFLFSYIFMQVALANKGNQSVISAMADTARKTRAAIARKIRSTISGSYWMNIFRYDGIDSTKRSKRRTIIMALGAVAAILAFAGSPGSAIPGISVVVLVNLGLFLDALRQSAATARQQEADALMAGPPGSSVGSFAQPISDNSFYIGSDEFGWKLDERTLSIKQRLRTLWREITDNTPSKLIQLSPDRRHTASLGSENSKTWVIIDYLKGPKFDNVKDFYFTSDGKLIIEGVFNNNKGAWALTPLSEVEIKSILETDSEISSIDLLKDMSVAPLASPNTGSLMDNLAILKTTLKARLQPHISIIKKAALLSITSLAGAAAFFGLPGAIEVMDVVTWIARHGLWIFIPTATAVGIIVNLVMLDVFCDKVGICNAIAKAADNVRAASAKEDVAVLSLAPLAINDNVFTAPEGDGFVLESPKNYFGSYGMKVRNAEKRSETKVRFRPGVRQPDSFIAKKIEGPGFRKMRILYLNSKGDAVASGAYKGKRGLWILRALPKEELKVFLEIDEELSDTAIEEFAVTPSKKTKNSPTAASALSKKALTTSVLIIAVGALAFFGMPEEASAAALRSGEVLSPSFFSFLLVSAVAVLALNSILKPTKYYAESRKKRKLVSTRVAAGPSIATAEFSTNIKEGPKENDAPYALMPPTPIGFHDYKTWWEFTSYGFKKIVPNENIHGLYFPHPIPWNPMSGEKYFKKKRSALTGRERTLLWRYARGIAFPINKYLRDPQNFGGSTWHAEGTKTEFDTEDIRSMAHEITETLKTSPLLPKNLMLYRWEIFVDREPYKDGEVFQKKDFTSTSIRPGSAIGLKNYSLRNAMAENPGKHVRTVNYRIIVNNYNTRGLYIDELLHDDFLERYLEVLLPPDLTFRVLRTEKVHGKLFQTLEIIDDVGIKENEGEAAKNAKDKAAPTKTAVLALITGALFLASLFMPGISEAATTAIDITNPAAPPLAVILNLFQDLSSFSLHRLAAVSPYSTSFLSFGFAGVLASIIPNSKSANSKNHTKEAIEALELLDMADSDTGDVSFSPDSNLIGLQHFKDPAKAFDIKRKKDLRGLIGSDAKTISFSPDNRYVFVKYRDKTAKVFDIKAGEDIRLPIGTDVFYASFSPDGKFIAVRRLKKPAKVFDLEKRKNLTRLIGGNVQTASFSPNSRLIHISYRNETSKVFDLTTGEDFQTQISGKLFYEAFSPDSKFIFVKYGDKTAKVFSIAEKKDLRLPTRNDVWGNSF